MKRFQTGLIRKFNNMKYRHKLTILLVVASLVPMVILAWYSHIRISSMSRRNAVEDMNSMLEQTREGIDSQIEVYSSLLNYLTYSPDIEEIINEKDIDNYIAYQKYTEIADPLLSVPKSYHDAILQIQLFAESIKVRHEYTLVPLAQIDKEWWNDRLSDDMKIQWLVERSLSQIAAVRKICRGANVEAVLCVTLDYDKLFQPFENIINEKCGGMILDSDGNIIYRKENFEDEILEKAKNSAQIVAALDKKYASVNSLSEESGWHFFLYKPQSVIDSTVSQILISEIPLICICAGLILALGLSFSRLFTRKIEELTENMNQVSQGVREVTVYSDSEDEVGLLIRGFQSMMDEINRLFKEVYESKIALKEFELKALTAQINPHFLYNSLSIINWMAIRSDQTEISRVTLALSTFYRTALSKGKDMVTVESCIQNIEAYLEIQLVMHDNDFKIEWKIDPDVKGEIVPKLLLQPVVENALEHGLDVKEEGEKILKLSFVQDGNDVLLMVEDNGAGMDQAEAETLVTYQAVGYGLKNVNDRICLLYGEDHKIRIYSKKGEGTRVEMRIPKGVLQSEN